MYLLTPPSGRRLPSSRSCLVFLWSSWGSPHPWGERGTPEGAEQCSHADLLADICPYRVWVVSGRQVVVCWSRVHSRRTCILDWKAECYGVQDPFVVGVASGHASPFLNIKVCRYIHPGALMVGPARRACCVVQHGRFMSHLQCGKWPGCKVLCLIHNIVPIVLLCQVALVPCRFVMFTVWVCMGRMWVVDSLKEVWHGSVLIHARVCTIWAVGLSSDIHVACWHMLSVVFPYLMSSHVWGRLLTPLCGCVRGHWYASNPRLA